VTLTSRPECHPLMASSNASPAPSASSQSLVQNQVRRAHFGQVASCTLTAPLSKTVWTVRNLSPPSGFRPGSQ